MRRCNRKRRYIFYCCPIDTPRKRTALVNIDIAIKHLTCWWMHPVTYWNSVPRVRR